MITQIFAHAGEEHSDTIEKLNHFLPWYFAIPLFLLLLAMIGYLVWIVGGRKIDTVVLVLAFICLICGFGLFVVSPAISVVAITLGIIMAGTLTFLGLTGDNKN
jgi:hypothetical protein